MLALIDHVIILWPFILNTVQPITASVIIFLTNAKLYDLSNNRQTLTVIDQGVIIHDTTVTLSVQMVKRLH